MKMRMIPKLAIVFGIVLLALLFFTLARTAPAPAQAPASVGNPLEISVVDSLPEVPLVMRDLIFYPPGQAPSEEMEFEPIPFESLLPGAESDGPIAVDNG